jgi:hypothetical protein
MARPLARAQSLLRELIPERLTVTKTPAGVRITGQATLGPVIATVLRGKGVPPG